MISLAELFPAGDFRHRLTLRRGEPRDFFRGTDSTGQVLAERRRWLATEPARHAALHPGGEPLLEEFAALSAEWTGTPMVDARFGPGASPDPDRARSVLQQLGGALEPDFLLLARDAAGAFRLRGGVLCFPTSWALDEKLGRTLEEIHAVVPGLNASLATPVHQFMTRLKPGAAFHRDNWGIAASDELNLHPARSIPPPMLPLALERLWLRVEHQALVALPQSDGVLFGIRIALHRLDEIARDRPVAEGLAHALATMPDELAAYKRLDSVRRPLIQALRAA